MEEILKANVPFIWNQECIDDFETLKKKLIEALILRFPNRLKKFHVHINSSAIVFIAILTQLGEENMDHSNFYASHKLNKVKMNYSTIDRKGLGMIFPFRNFSTIF